MARALDDADRARGGRVAEIRALLGLTQPRMAEALNDVAERLGLADRYEYYHVSRMEGGSISFEDAFLVLQLDPRRRAWEWFVFGDEQRAAVPPARRAPPMFHGAEPGTAKRRQEAQDAPAPRKAAGGKRQK